MTSYSYKDFRKDLRNVGFVLLVLWVVLAAIGLVYPLAWSFLFAVMLGFVIFDATFGLFLKRRKVPISGSQKFQPSGYRFLAFSSGIVIASLISATFAEGIAQLLGTTVSQSFTDSSCKFRSMSSSLRGLSPSG
jgi:membrane protease YdiL (CAAX protease family)